MADRKYNVDGDTVDDGGQRIRARGYNAHELGEPGGLRAARVVQRELDWDRLEVDGTDAHGRGLSKFYGRDGEDLGPSLARRGYAAPMRGSSQAVRDGEATFALRGAPGGELWETDETRQHRELMQREAQARGVPNPAQAGNGFVQATSGDFARGWARGMEGFRTAGGGLTAWAGEVLGDEGMQAFGADVIQRSQMEMARFEADVGTYKNIEGVADAWTYAKETFGEVLPSLISSLATAGIGGAAGRVAAGSLAKNMVKKYGAEEAKRRVGRMTASGALTGVWADSTGQNMGHIQHEMMEHGLSAPGKVLTAGAAAGALDAGGMAVLFGPVFRALPKGIKTENLYAIAAQEAGKFVAKGAGLEAMINPAQGALAMTVRTMEDPQYNWLSGEERQATFERLFEEALKGTVGGVAMGSLGGAAQGGRVLSQGAPEPEAGSEGGEGDLPPSDEEPSGQIGAQVEAAARGERPDVYVEADEAGNVPTPKSDRRLQMVSVPNLDGSVRGGFFVTPRNRKRMEQQVQELHEAGVEGPEISGRLLGYLQTKEEVAAGAEQGDTPVAVRTLDPETGAALYEQVVNQSRADEAVELHRQYSPEAKIEVTPVEAALDQRRQDVEAEQEQGQEQEVPPPAETQSEVLSAENKVPGAEQLRDGVTDTQDSARGASAPAPALSAQGEVAQGEVAQGEVAQGEVAQGEVAQGEAEAEAAQPEAAQGEAAQGELEAADGPTPLKKATGKREDREQFSLRVREGAEAPTASVAAEFEMFGERFVLHGESKAWAVSHPDTGFALDSGPFATQAEAYEAGVARLEQVGKASLLKAIGKETQAKATEPKAEAAQPEAPTIDRQTVINEAAANEDRTAAQAWMRARRDGETWTSEFKGQQEFVGLVNQRREQLRTERLEAEEAQAQVGRDRAAMVRTAGGRQPGVDAGQAALPVGQKPADAAAEVQPETEMGRQLREQMEAQAQQEEAGRTEVEPDTETDASERVELSETDHGDREDRKVVLGEAEGAERFNLPPRAAKRTAKWFNRASWFGQMVEVGEEGSGVYQLDLPQSTEAELRGAQQFLEAVVRGIDAGKGVGLKNRQGIRFKDEGLDDSFKLDALALVYAMRDLGEVSYDGTQAQAVASAVAAVLEKGGDQLQLDMKDTSPVFQGIGGRDSVNWRQFGLRLSNPEGGDPKFDQRLEASELGRELARDQIGRDRSEDRGAPRFGHAREFGRFGEPVKGRLQVDHSNRGEQSQEEMDAQQAEGSRVEDDHAGTVARTPRRDGRPVRAAQAPDMESALARDDQGTISEAEVRRAEQRATQEGTLPVNEMGTAQHGERVAIFTKDESNPKEMAQSVFDLPPAEGELAAQFEKAAQTLKDLNIRVPAMMLTRAQARALSTQLKALGTPWAQQMRENLNRSLKGNESPGTVVYNDNMEAVQHRMPIIVIDGSVGTPKQRARVLLHEVGHLVHRAIVDQRQDVLTTATDESGQTTQVPDFGAELRAPLNKAFEDDFGKALGELNLDERQHLFEEWFAERYAQFVGDNKTTRTGVWHHVKQTFRRVWSGFRKDSGETFSAFMRAMQNRTQPQRGELITELEALGVKNVQRVADAMIRVRTGLAKAQAADKNFDNFSMADFQKSIWGRRTKAAISELQALGMSGWETVLASNVGTMARMELESRHHFHKEAGNKAKTQPIAAHERIEMGKADAKLAAVAKAFGVKTERHFVLLRKYNVDGPEFKLLREAFREAAVSNEGVAKARKLLLDKNFSALSTEQLARRTDAAAKKEVELRRALDEYQSFMDGMWNYLTEAGMRVPFAEGGHVPVQMSFSKINKDKDGAVAAFKKMLQSKENRDAKAEKREPATITTQRAETALQHLEYDNGMFELAQDAAPGDSNFGPGARHTRARRFQPDDWKHMQAFVEDDFLSVARFYASRAVRRAEHHRVGGHHASRFWIPIKEERQIQQDIERAEAAGDTEQAKSLKLALVKRKKDLAAEREKKMLELEGLGINRDMLGQPTVKFLEEAARKRRAGKITQAEYKHFAERILPSLTGQLGASMHPRYRRFAQWAQTYQTVRLLAFAWFSSVMDAGVLAWNIGDVRILRDAIKMDVGKLNKAQNKEMAEFIGIAQTMNTEHYLNAEFGPDQFNMTMANKISEVFFRANFMHQYTEKLRRVGMLAGQRVFITEARKAKKGNQKSVDRLAEYGLDADMVLRNIADEHHLANLTGGSQDSRPLAAAVNMFVDEGVMRPSAATRPWWATHPVGKVVFFLKGFMYQFQAVVLQKVLNSVRNQPGKWPRKTLAGVMSTLPMVAWTLPLTMMGYELRRQAGTLFDDDLFEKWERDGPAEYMKEMVRRSGYLGVAETTFMMDDDRARGSSALNALLGPTGGQVLDGISGGLGEKSWWTSGAPVAPAVPFMRENL